LICDEFLLQTHVILEPFLSCLQQRQVSDYGALLPIFIDSSSKLCDKFSQVGRHQVVLNARIPDKNIVTPFLRVRHSHCLSYALKLDFFARIPAQIETQCSAFFATVQLGRRTQQKSLGLKEQNPAGEYSVVSAMI